MMAGPTEQESTADFEAAWTKLAAERREPQISLGLEPTDELPLDGTG